MGIYPWSHSASAKTDLYHNIHDLDVESLREIYAEIKAGADKYSHEESDDEFDKARYYKALSKSQDISRENLAQFVWGYAEMIRRCKDGARKAIVCPFGCHTVPFNRNKNVNG